MKFKCQWVTVLIIAILSVAALLTKPVLSRYNSWRANHLICGAHLFVVRDNARLSLMIKYYLDGTRGVVNYQGMLEDGEGAYNVSRAVDLSVSEYKNMMTVKSTEVTVSPADNAPLRKLRGMFPAAYLEKNKNFNFEVYPQTSEGYIFSTGNIPSFYCADTA